MIETRQANTIGIDWRFYRAAGRAKLRRPNNGKASRKRGGNCLSVYTSACFVCGVHLNFPQSWRAHSPGVFSNLIFVVAGGRRGRSRRVSARRSKLARRGIPLARSRTVLLSGRGTSAIDELTEHPTDRRRARSVHKRPTWQHFPAASDSTWLSKGLRRDGKVKYAAALMMSNDRTRQTFGQRGTNRA